CLDHVDLGFGEGQGEPAGPFGLWRGQGLQADIELRQGSLASWRQCRPPLQALSPRPRQLRCAPAEFILPPRATEWSSAHPGIPPSRCGWTRLMEEHSMSRETERKNKSLRRFHSIGEVEAITSLSRATIYRKMADGTFPSSVPISKGRVGWERQTVDEWCEARLAGRQGKQGA